MFFFQNSNLGHEIFCCTFFIPRKSVLGRWTRGYSFVACLSNLTVDHASLSRRSTVPTPNRDLQHLSAHHVFFICLHRFFLLMLSPCCFAVCGHHLTPRIAIFFSLLCSAPNFSMPHSSTFLIYSSNTSRSSFYVSHSPTMRGLLSTASPQGHICAISSSSPRLLAHVVPISSFSQVQVSTRNRSFRIFA